MLSSLLIATDASEASDCVVDCVQHLRRVGSRHALLVHVLDVRDVGGLSTTLRRAILPKLESQQRTLAAAGFETRIDVPLVARHAPLPVLFVPPSMPLPEAVPQVEG
jgi:nucleotide-binding universal stress UspA family protein